MNLRIWQGLRLRQRFEIIVGAGLVVLVSAVVALIVSFEEEAMERKLNQLSVNEMTSLHALIVNVMTKRPEDGDNIGIQVFNNWFGSRNADYPGKVWSAWGPKVAQYMKETAPEKAAKPPQDGVDSEALATGRPVARFEGESYRYAMPIVLGVTDGAKAEVCHACHGDGMGMKDGEVIAVLSSSLSTAVERAALHKVLAWLGGGGLAATVLAMVLMRWILTGVITRPLGLVTATMGRLAGGDTQVAVDGTGKTDEIGDIARAVQVFKDTMIEADRLRGAQEEDRRKASDLLRREMLSLTELLEAEIDTTVTEISAQAGRLSSGATRLLSTADSLKAMATAMSSAVETTSGNVQTVAGATEQLEASSREIAHRVQRSSTLSDAAFHQAEVAGASVAGLSDATARIGEVVNLIQAIAGQTRMLALNATIEAVRAGDAGKGFAVVADEVKGLAQQTEDAIGRVSAQAQEIGNTTREAVATVEAVAETIREMTAIAADVAISADEQTSATGEIMASAVQAARHTTSIADNAQQVLSASESTGGTARSVSDLSARVSNNIAALKRRLTVILRNSISGNRRTVERVAASLPFAATLGDSVHRGVTSEFATAGHTGDVSVAGALLVVPDVADLEGRTGTVEFEGVGRIEVRAVLCSPLGLHVKFVNIDPDQEKALEAAIERACAVDAHFIANATRLAADAGAAFERAVREGRITMDDLFDTEYVTVEDTDPVQVMARHTELTDSVLPALIEPPLAENARIVFCCATDRTGYIATHNKIYSQAQRRGERDWNVANSRNRRIFDDRTGILAARNSESPLVQAYARDMGGAYQVVKEIDAPITVNGRHWGAIRLAMTLR